MKICPKCHKRITVDEYEFCCPLCGEFIRDVDNASVQISHATRNVVEEVKPVARLYKAVSAVFAFFLLLFTAFAIFLTVMMKNPKLILMNMHFSAVIGISVMFALILLVLSVIVLKKHKKQECNHAETHKELDKVKNLGIGFILLSAGALIVMVIGLTNIKNTTIELSCAEDFKIYDNLPNPENCKYKLTSDIDFNGGAPEFWNKFSIGDMGEFDGGGHIIKNIVIEDGAVNDNEGASGNYTYFGMFATNYGIIKNLIIENCEITSLEGGYHFYMGAICGYNAGLISNCEANDVFLVQGTRVNGGQCYLGGIVGCNKMGTVESCKFVNLKSIYIQKPALKSSTRLWGGCAYTFDIAPEGEIVGCYAEYQKNSKE